MKTIKKFNMNKNLIVFIIGFLAGLIPTLLFLLYIDPLSSFWSLLIGSLLGVIGILVFFIYKRYKIVGMILLLILILSYIIFIYILWDLRQGYFGGFIG